MDYEKRDNVQHGIDDNPSGDAEKGATLGGIGGAVVGGIAGSAAGPVGTIIGVIVGAAGGAVGSGLGVAAVDRIDNDNTVTGIGDNPDWERHDDNWREHYNSNYAATNTPYDSNYQHAYRYGHDVATHPSYEGRSWDEIQTNARQDWESRNPGTWDTYQEPIRYSYEGSRLQHSGGMGTSRAYADNAPGIQTGGQAMDGTPDTRGITEKVSDYVTGDRVDDKTGKSVNPPGIQTGGHAVDGTPDTRGLTEKAADTLTGDRTDDKTGKQV